MNSFLIPAAAGGAGLALFAWQVRRRAIDRWLVPYLRQSFRRSPGDKRVCLLLCVADHFEPRHAATSVDQARARVDRWVAEYPRLFGDFRDADGRPPRHSFFYPMEAYDRWEVERIAELCRRGFGEVEVHLHHDRDTDSTLRAKLKSYVDTLVGHGLLSRDPRTGEKKYGFIHGNWALANCLPDGRWCGVDNELDVLRETGCYADFTFPSAPERNQPRTINQIYYAPCGTGKRCPHESGVPVGTGTPPDQRLMLIPGPLTLDWKRRKWGIMPRIENACIQARQPAQIDRLRLWRKARVQVPARPDWYFVKLHTHGAPEWNQAVVLGEPMRQFHADLASFADRNPWFSYHYVTAREMYNLARAAEAGWTGSVADARNYELRWDHDHIQ
jgi:hypothetical protein